MTGSFQFHFSEKGERNNPSLLLLHGFLGRCHDWDEVMTGLSRTFHCLAVDLPGHGQTKADGDDANYGMKRLAGGVIELLAQLPIKRWHFIFSSV